MNRRCTSEHGIDCIFLAEEGRKQNMDIDLLKDIFKRRKYRSNFSIFFPEWNEGKVKDRERMIVVMEGYVEDGRRDHIFHDVGGEMYQ